MRCRRHIDDILYVAGRSPVEGQTNYDIMSIAAAVDEDEATQHSVTTFGFRINQPAEYLKGAIHDIPVRYDVIWDEQSLRDWVGRMEELYDDRIPGVDPDHVLFAVDDCRVDVPTGLPWISPHLGNPWRPFFFTNPLSQPRIRHPATAGPTLTIAVAGSCVGSSCRLGELPRSTSALPSSFWWMAALMLKRRIAADLIEFFGEDVIQRLLEGHAPAGTRIYRCRVSGMRARWHQVLFLPPRPSTPGFRNHIGLYLMKCIV